MKTTRQSLSNAGQLERIFTRDPDVKKLVALASEEIALPAMWFTRGTSYVYPPAFVPILHDTSGTSYGAWHHPNLARRPCFVGLTTEQLLVKEIARDVRQFWTFLALLSISIDSEHTRELETFLQGFDVTAASIVEASLEVGDDRDLFGAHPAFADNCPASLRTDRAPDSAFPSLERRETWPLACRYELEVADPAAPRWLRESPAKVFRDEMSTHSWTGAWLALNAPNWEIDDARAAADKMRSAFPELETSSIVNWSNEVSGFPIGY